MPRPKSTEPIVALNARVPLDLRERGAIAASLLDSDLSKEIRKMLKELIAKAETIHGPILLPANPSPPPPVARTTVHDGRGPG